MEKVSDVIIICFVFCYELFNLFKTFLFLKFFASSFSFWGMKRVNEISVFLLAVISSILEFTGILITASLSNIILHILRKKSCLGV